MVKSSEGRNGAVSVKSSSNIGEEYHTSERMVNVMFVYVVNCHGQPLMPCQPRKARLLLQEGKAKVAQMVPVTIQLLFKSYPFCTMTVHVSQFDMQKIRHPELEGKAYQQCPQSGFWNVREYVLFRDQHCCQWCRGQSKNPILNVHHIESRKTGGD